MFTHDYRFNPLPEKGLEAGFFRYLTKPIKVNEFLNSLDEALEFAEKGTSQCK